MICSNVFGEYNDNFSGFISGVGRMGGEQGVPEKLINGKENA